MSARVYIRKFDWDEAKRLRERGLTIGQVAIELGVSKNMVWVVTTPGAYEKLLERNKERARSGGTCVDCGTAISLNYSRRAQRCSECYAYAQTVNVRDKELRCTTCRKWKPDEEFPRNRSAGFTRRGRHKECRACNTIRRREYRNRNKVPCANPDCDNLVLAPNELRRNGKEPTGLCRSCWSAHARRRQEA